MAAAPPRPAAVEDFHGITRHPRRYNFDSHNVARYACQNASACLLGTGAPAGADAAFAWDEGDVEVTPGGAYQIPYDVLLPDEAECSNLLVVGTPSASHIGLSTLRMEPQYMILGHAAGVAAAIAAEAGVSVQRVDRATLRAQLVAGGARLDPPGRRR